MNMSKKKKKKKNSLGNVPVVPPLVLNSIPSLLVLGRERENISHTFDSLCEYIYRLCVRRRRWKLAGDPGSRSKLRI
jgi:hypothetical protein